jgi:hypothetical protein
VVLLAARLNIWIDESYTLDTTGSGLGYALHQSAYLESQPPLYFLLLAAWRTLDGSILFARLFSVLSICGLLLCAPALARRYLPGLDPGWLLLALACSPFLVWAATEIRLYAFSLLLSGLLLLAFHQAFLAGRVRAGRAAVFGLTALAGALTHYYLWFLHLGFLAVLLAARRREGLKAYLLTMAAVSVCSAPLLWLLLPRVLDTAGELRQAQGLPLASALKTIGLRFQEYLLPVDQLPRVPRLAARLLFLAAAAAALFFARRSLARERAAAWLITAAAAAAFLAVLAGISGYLGMRRHTFVLFLPGWLAFLSLFPRESRVARRSLAFAVPALVLVSLFSLYRTYQPMAKSGDYARVAAYLQSEERPGQPILAFNSESAMPLARYYRGVNRIVPLPSPPSLQSFRERNFVIQSGEQVAAVLAAAAPGHRWAWYVRSGAEGNRGWSYHPERLESYLAGHYTVLQSRSFYGCRVQLLRRSEG